MPMCPDHPDEELAPKRKGWFCARCDDVVLTYEECPREGMASTTLVQRAGVDTDLPMALALPLRDMLQPGPPVLALWAACDAVEVALKLCVMTALAQRARTPPELAAALKDRIELPTLGKWLGMAQAVARHEPEGATLPVAGLVRATDALLGDRDASVSTGLLALRNRLAHGGPLPHAEAARLHELWLPRMQAWAADPLAPLRAVTLVAVDASGQRWSLRGTDAIAVTNPAVPATAPPGSTWLCSADRAFALDPLAAFDAGLQLYVRRGDLRLQYLRLGDEGGLVDSRPEAMERFREMFLTAPRRTDGDARPFAVRDFHADIRKEASRRVGRDRELATLLDAVQGMDGGFLWVSGAAGMGKSNLMAALMEELLDAAPSRRLVLAYRFRAGDDRCGRGPFLAFVHERLASSGLLHPDEAPATAARTGDDPVSDLCRGLGRLRDDARVVLLVDGLDELVERDARFVQDVLLPLGLPRVSVVAAGRPERGLPEAFAAVGAVTPFPEGLPPMGDDDVRALLLERTGPVRRRLLARDRETAEGIQNAFIARVTRESGGLPIYVNYVVGDLNAGRLHPEAPDALPNGLHAYHEELLRRASVGDLQAVTTPVLVLLALAQEPLGISTIAALLARWGVLERPDPAIVERGVHAVATMVRRAATPEGDEGFTVFHHSLRTHVRQDVDLQRTVAAARRALAEAARDPSGDAAETYLYRCGVMHLLDAARVDDALALLTDFAYTLARLRRLADTGRAAQAWHADWERAVAAVASLEPDAAAWWEFVRTTRHHYEASTWEPWRVCFQTAMDHADTSVVTRAAEAYEASGKRDWPWLRWENRPARRDTSANLATLRGHTEVGGMLVLQDGRLLSWAGWSDREPAVVRIWDVARGRQVAALATPGDGQPLGVFQHEDGRVVTVGRGGFVTWDPATAARVSSAVERDARCFLRLRNGTLAIGTVDCLVVRDLEGAPPTWAHPIAGGIGQIHETVSGRLLTIPTTHYDGAPRVHDTTVAGVSVALAAAPDEIHGIVELDVDTLLTWPHADRGEPPRLRLWDLRTLSLRHECTGHEGEIFEVVRADDGTFWTASRDRTRRRWDPSSGACIEVAKGTVGPKRAMYRGLVHVAMLNSAAERKVEVARSTKRDWHNERHRLADGHVLWLSSDAKVLAPDGETLLQTLPLRRRPKLWQGGIAELALPDASGGSKRALAIVVDGGDIEVTEIRPGASVAAKKTTDATALHTLEPIGEDLLLSYEGEHAATWDARTGARVAMFGESRHMLRGAVGLPDGTVVVRSARVVLHCDPRNGRLLTTLSGHEDAIHGACPLAGGRLLSWSKDRTIRVWSLTDGACLVTYAEHRYHDISVQVCSDGRVVSWDRDTEAHPLRVWDPSTGQTLAVHEGLPQEVQGVLELPDGGVIAWGWTTVHRWNAGASTAAVTFTGHTNAVLGAGLTEAGHLLTWSADRTFRTWEFDTGREVGRLKLPPAPQGRPSFRGAVRLGSGNLLARSYPGWPHYQERTLHLVDPTGQVLLGTVAPRTPGDLGALLDLVGDLDAVAEEAFHQLRLEAPHEHTQPVFLPGGRVVYTDGTRLRVTRIVVPPTPRTQAP